MVGKVWDAITDPMMGNITDRTSSRFGPKRLYIIDRRNPIGYRIYLALDNDSIAKHYGTIYLLYSDVLLIFDVLHNHNGPLQRSPAGHGWIAMIFVQSSRVLE